MDQLRPMCAILESDIQFHKRRHLNFRGGTGGSPSEFYCFPEEVITSITPPLVQNNFPTSKLHHFVFVCSSVKTWAARPVTIGAPGKYVGNLPVFDMPLQTCPSGEMANGVQLRYGTHVNAISLICDRYKVADEAAPKQGEGWSSKTFVVVAGDQKGHWALSVGYPAKAAAIVATMKTCGTGCQTLHENKAKCVAVAESTPPCGASPRSILWTMPRPERRRHARNRPRPMQDCRWEM